MVSGQVASSQCRGRAAGKGPISLLTSDEVEALKTHINSAPADGKVALFRNLWQGFGDQSVKVIVGQMAGKKESITALTMGFQSKQREQPARFSAVKKS